MKNENWLQLIATLIIIFFVYGLFVLEIKK
jgi:hypothetical protein